jgi:hypothetical protein
VAARAAKSASSVALNEADDDEPSTTTFALSIVVDDDDVVVVVVVVEDLSLSMLDRDRLRDSRMLRALLPRVVVPLLLLWLCFTHAHIYIYTTFYVWIH